MPNIGGSITAIRDKCTADPPCPPRRPVVAGDAAAVDKAAAGPIIVINNSFGTGLPTRRSGAA
jgi:hypothetical protein